MEWHANKTRTLITSESFIRLTSPGGSESVAGQHPLLEEDRWAKRRDRGREGACSEPTSTAEKPSRDPIETTLPGIVAYILVVLEERLEPREAPASGGRGCARCRAASFAVRVDWRAGRPKPGRPPSLKEGRAVLAREGRDLRVRERELGKLLRRHRGDAKKEVERERCEARRREEVGQGRENEGGRGGLLALLLGDGSALGCWAEG